MKANVGGADRVIRVLGGAGLIAFGVLGSLLEPWNYVAMGAGGVFLLTGLMRFCLLYTLFGVKTCKGTSD